MKPEIKIAYLIAIVLASLATLLLGIWNLLGVILIIWSIKLLEHLRDIRNQPLNRLMEALNRKKTPERDKK